MGTKLEEIGYAQEGSVLANEDPGKVPEHDSPRAVALKVLWQTSLFPDPCNKPGSAVAEADAMWQLFQLMSHQRSE